MVQIGVSMTVIAQSDEGNALNLKRSAAETCQDRLSPTLHED